jgi:hypothetical protein
MLHCNHSVYATQPMTVNPHCPRLQIIIEDDDGEADKSLEKKSSFFGVTCNYVNSIIGSGIIGIYVLHIFFEFTIGTQNRLVIWSVSKFR